MIITGYAIMICAGLSALSRTLGVRGGTPAAATVTTGPLVVVVRLLGTFVRVFVVRTPLLERLSDVDDGCVTDALPLILLLFITVAAAVADGDIIG